MTRLSPCLDSLDRVALCRCGNCGTETPLEKLAPIADAHLRITPGEETPAGECPECGALAYLVKPEPAATVPPATVYIVTREACELTDWTTESEAFASEPDARAYARKAAHEFSKTEEVQGLLIPGGEPLEIAERPDGFRVDDGNNVNVMFQVHACPVAPTASETNLTPGPWDWKTNRHDPDRFSVWPADVAARRHKDSNASHVVADFYGPDGRANAIQASAAPEMVALLREMIHGASTWSNDEFGEWLNRATDLFNQATDYAEAVDPPRVPLQPDGLVTIPHHVARHAVLWLGRCVAEGAHRECVLPNNCEATAAHILACMDAKGGES